MVAGFENPDAGDIRIDGQSVLRLRPNKRQIGMVFQSYALFPNLTVAGNVAFGLTVAGIDRAESARRVDEMLDMVGLTNFRARYPFQLSGGQQQRVALARAIAPRPRVLLLDEPLSALDAKIRVSLRAEIRTIQRHLGITTLFVTHDQEEALSMSDRIVVMNAGRAEQIGSPEAVYNRPTSRFVAEFIGSLNLVQGQRDAQSGTILRFDGGEVPLAGGSDAGRGQSATVAIRPQALRPCPPEQAALRGVVKHIEFLGAFTRLHVTCGSTTLLVDCLPRDLLHAPPINGPIGLALAAEDIQVLSA
jgi:putative spermidine/putrescine transport system ATP-binding protein